MVADLSKLRNLTVANVGTVKKETLGKINEVAGVKTVSATRKVDVFYRGIAVEAKVKSWVDYVDTACAACLRGMAVDSKKVTALP
eukprot:2300476-Amphidinium_carterae.1